MRLYFESDCRAATDPSASAVPFPVVNVQRASKGKDGVAAIREIFAKDKKVTVTEASDGVIRIRIGKVPATILQTKISQLGLNPMRQYNPPEIFDAIVETKEMEGAMDSLRFKQVYHPSSDRVEPDNSFPHLPATLTNVTAEQVLDEVAKTWAGMIVVIYGECAESTNPDGKLFYFGWTGQIAPKDLR
ncbi:MAG: hypothetical protein ACJ8M1_13045 [Chthoniobacterales bacterium]